MADLEWSAEVSDNAKEWLFISANGDSTESHPWNPIINGTGNTNIDINVKPSVPGTEQETGTITITSGDLVKVITVDRCGNDCGCDKVSPSVDKVTFDWDAKDDGDKKPFLLIPECVQDESLVKVSVEGNFDVDLSPLDSTYSVYPVGANETDNTKYGTLTVQYGGCKEFTIELEQSTNPCTCDKIQMHDYSWSNDNVDYVTILEIKDTSCYSLGDGTVEATADAHRYTVGDFTLQFQYPPSAATTYAGWFDKFATEISVSNDKSKILVHPFDNNTAMTDYECDVVVTYLKNGSQQQCSKSATLTQSNGGPCKCGKLKPVTPVDEAVEWEAGELGAWKPVAIGTNDRCVSLKNVKINCEKGGHFISNNYDNGRITVCPRAKNTGTKDIPAEVVITYELPDGTECGQVTKSIVHKADVPLYVHAKAASESVAYEGGDVLITYYISYNQEYNEEDAIDDEGNCLSLGCVEGVTCGTKTQDGKLFKQSIHFDQLSIGGGDVGHTWEFNVTCSGAKNNEVVKIYQASRFENIIPNCDYFIFNYTWKTSDGEDLDSLTRISIFKKVSDTEYVQKSCKIGNNELSGRTVGFAGNVPYKAKDGVSRYAPLEVSIGGKNVPLLVFGGDNLCNGSEYTVICFKNLIDYGTSPEVGWISKEDEIWIDVYANWYMSKGPTHKMSVQYKQYSGLTDSAIADRYANEIDEEKVTSCKTENYFIIKGKPEPACREITSKTKADISVSAAGSNSTYARNTDCLVYNENYPLIPYEHVFRLKYNIKENRTYMQEIPYVDKGIDSTIKDKVVLYTENNTNHEEKYSASYDYTVSPNGQHIVLDKFYFKYDGNGVTKEIYPFDTNGDSMYAKERYGEKKEHTFIKTDFNNGVTDTYNFSYIHNLKITKYTSGSDKGKLKIEFDYDAGTERRQFEFIFTTKIDFLFPCTISYSFNSINFNQNY